MTTEGGVTPCNEMMLGLEIGLCKTSHAQTDGPRRHLIEKSKGMKVKNSIPKLAVGRDI